MKVENKIILLSAVAGFFAGAVDTAIYTFFFYKGSFLEHAFFNVSPFEIYVRSFIFITFIAYGVLISRIFAGRRRAEEKLKRYTKELEEANRFKDLFTDIINHDLLNPASTAANAVEIMKSWELDEEQDEIRSILERKCRRVIGLIQDSGTYAKITDANQMDRDDMDLNEVFRKAVDAFKLKLKEKKMKLDYLIEGERRANVNPTIWNVFSNLLSNAIKYSPDGGRIEVGAEEGNDSHTFYVKDWGYGIDDDLKERLFWRFERGHKRGIRGVGLGLAIVKRIVELHGGKVWVEDNPEGGSIFYVKIQKDNT